ncbi:DUF1684 domain-containing protein [Lacisediminihabitans changchengi]|uniref:DUF1684 domain-containing protein n=1 Tax=Lacisediminihabitans changchengi TaxID=2787634 RepID=A0A934SJ84_9MICO|nr:DUF1684 domain-containing protein [Lacisediminihabitans changchengi]MBK4346588.1 DUF1684 domain-containing protein [Lacisediminihabitans changchengi]
MTAPATVDAARTSRDGWRAARRARVTGPQGDLALIETRWLNAGETVTDAAALEGQPDTVTVTRLHRLDLDTGGPQEGIRLWDANSPAIQHFDEVPVFPFNPDWVIEAEFTHVGADRTVAFEHLRDNGSTRELAVPGDIRFSRDGVDYTLSAFDDGGVLLLVFADPTNQLPFAEGGTYPSGRFLFVERPEGSDFDSEGRVVLDFNKAFVPPCGFSDQYNCPLPPKQNRFTVPIEAGERDIVFADGFENH